MSLANAYYMRKRMAKGGMCEHGLSMCEMCHGGKMAEGGFIEEEKASGYGDMPMDGEKMNMAAEMEDEDMIDRIMRQRYSEGGKVANDSGPIADEESAEYDDLVKDDDLEMHDTGANSGDELGDAQEDEDRHDVVARIMRSRAKKDRLPRPA